MRVEPEGSAEALLGAGRSHPASARCPASKALQAATERVPIAPPESALNPRRFNQQGIGQEVEPGFGIAQVSGDLGLPFPDDGAIAAHVVERGPNVDRIAEAQTSPVRSRPAPRSRARARPSDSDSGTRLSPPPVGYPERIDDSQVFPTVQRRVEKGFALVAGEQLRRGIAPVAERNDEVSPSSSAGPGVGRGRVRINPATTRARTTTIAVSSLRVAGRDASRLGWIAASASEN